MNGNGHYSSSPPPRSGPMRKLVALDYPELPHDVATSPLGIAHMNLLVGLNNNLGAIADKLHVISERLGLTEDKFRARLDTLPEFVEDRVEQATKHGFTELELKMVKAGAEKMFAIKVTFLSALFAVLFSAAYEFVKVRMGH
jgi:hypothetical protein